MSDFALLEMRVNATQAEMMQNFSKCLYGDDKPAPPLSRRERLMRYISVRRERIHDAWLVLTGKADIGY